MERVMAPFPVRRALLSILAVALPALVAANEPAPITDLYGDPLPPGAIARLGTLRFRAAERIDHLAYSPDGKKLVSHGGGVITLWDAESGRKLAEFDGSEVGPLAWRADGSGVMLVQEPDGALRIGDFTRERLKPAPRFPPPPPVVPPPDNEQINGYAVSPAGTHLVAGRRGNHDRARAITVWKIEPGKRLSELRKTHELGPQRGNCHQIVFSPDDKFVGVVSGPAGIDRVNEDRPPPATVLFVLYDLATGKERFRRDIATPYFHRGGATMALAPGGHTLAVGGNDAVFRVYALDQKVADVSFGEAKKPHSFGGLPAVVIARERVFAVQWNRIQVLDAKTGRAVRPPIEMDLGVEALAVSPDETRLAVAGEAGIVRLIDIATARVIDTMPGHAGLVGGVRMFGAGDQVLTWGYGEHRLWETGTGKSLRRFRLAYTDQFCLTADATTILSPVDLKLRAFDIATGKQGDVPAAMVEAAKWIRNQPGDGRSVISLDDDIQSLHLSIWDWPEGKLRKRIKIELDTASWHARRIFGGGEAAIPFRDAYLAPDGKLLITRGSYGVEAWDTATGEHRAVLQRFSFGTDPDSMAFLNDGRQLALFGVDLEDRSGWGRREKRIGLLDLRSAKLVRTFAEPGSSRTCSLAADPGGYVVATAEEAEVGFTLLFEVASGQIRKRLPGHFKSNTGVAFTPEGHRLVTVGADSTGLVWDVSLMSAARGKTPATGAELERAWDTLAKAKAPAAYEAMIALASNPAGAVELLRRRLQPARLDAAALNRVLADLESEKFTVRDRAVTELGKVGRNAVPTVRARADKAESLETKRRLQRFLEQHDTGTLLPDELRAVRCLEFLEHAATPAARKLIAELSKGEPTADLTMRALSAQRRLERR
jgi:WD40 repeat protein